MTHLEKHVRLWEKDVGDVVLVAVPLSVLLMVSEQEILRRVREEMLTHISSHSVFLHIFSNGGLVYGSRAIVLLGDRVRGVCFDSCPSLDDTAAVPATVAREAIGGSPLVKRLVFSSVFGVFHVIFTLKRWLGTPFSQSQYSGANLIQNMNPRAKKLFFYSSKDVITDAALLRDFVQKIGGDSFDFGDSKHVQHFRKYPELYEERLTATLLNKTKT